MKYNFCHYCGKPTTYKKIESKNRSYCDHCNIVLYKNPIPSVAIVAFNENNELLLTRRAIAPGKGLWCLPGGFVESGETIQQTVKRELKEETHLDCEATKLIGADSVINGYWGDILILGYSVKLLPGKLIAGDDAAEAKFFAISSHPKIVFPVHEKFLTQYLESHEK